MEAIGQTLEVHGVCMSALCDLFFGMGFVLDYLDIGVLFPQFLCHLLFGPHIESLKVFPVFTLTDKCHIVLPPNLRLQIDVHRTNELMEFFMGNILSVVRNMSRDLNHAAVPILFLVQTS